MIGLLDASFRKGDTVLRVVGEGKDMTTRDFHLFCPLAMAGLGRLPDTLQHRSIVITLQRKAPGVKVVPFRRSEALETLAELHRRLAAWAQRSHEAVTAARPVIPESVTDRAADKWEALLAVAEVAGGRWPELAAEAAVAFTAEENRDDENDTLALRLLVDLAEVWPPGLDEWKSTEVVSALKVLGDAPWIELGKNGLTTTRLAAMLRPFEVIASRPPGHREAMRYEVVHLVTAWRQYGIELPAWCACQVQDPAPKSAQSAQSAHTTSEQGEQCADLQDTGLRNPAQDGATAQTCADSQDPSLRTITAGQGPSAQGEQSAQTCSEGSEADMHASTVVRDDVPLHYDGFELELLAEMMDRAGARLHLERGVRPVLSFTEAVPTEAVEVAARHHGLLVSAWTDQGSRVIKLCDSCRSPFVLAKSTKSKCPVCAKGSRTVVVRVPFTALPSRRKT
jgi:hypothetical protein